MAHVDLNFPVLGTALPADHGYALYGAISRVLGADAHSNNGIGIFAVRGLPAGPGLLHLEPRRSALRIRTPVEYLPVLLKLAGRQLGLDAHTVRLGVPSVMALTPAPTLHARVVTIKGFREPEPFLDAVRRQLADPPNPDPAAPPERRGGLGLSTAVQAAIPLRRTGPNAGQPTRRIVRIKEKKVVGFSLLVSNLTAEESIRLQENGLGGRRHMGCGLFLALRGN